MNNGNLNFSKKDYLNLIYEEIKRIENFNTSFKSASLSIGMWLNVESGVAYSK